MESYNFDEIFALFMEECEDYGITVKKGTGRITKDGEDFDIAKAVEDIFGKRITVKDTMPEAANITSSTNVNNKFEPDRIALLAA